MHFKLIWREGRRTKAGTQDAREEAAGKASEEARDAKGEEGERERKGGCEAKGGNERREEVNDKPICR